MKRARTVKAWGLKSKDGFVSPYTYATEDRVKEEHPFALQYGSKIIKVEIKELTKRPKLKPSVLLDTSKKIWKDGHKELTKR